MDRKEEYQEAECCFQSRYPKGNESSQKEHPVKERIRRLDELLGRNQKEEAGVFLRDWLKEAREQGDWSSELTVLNEMMGLYRNTGEKERGLCAVEEGLALVRSHSMQNTVTGATTWINGATTLKAFGRTEEAVPYYEEAFRVYGEYLDPADYRFAGLFNNMALALSDLEDYRQAEAYFRKAMDIMGRLPEGEKELAVSWMNLACLYAQWGREEKAREALDRAMECLDSPNLIWDSYYAFTCEKCAGTFGQFGQSGRKKDLEERAAVIYEGA